MAGRCSRIPVTYLGYGAVWKEARLLPSSDILVPRPVLPETGLSSSHGWTGTTLPSRPHLRLGLFSYMLACLKSGYQTLDILELLSYSHGAGYQMPACAPVLLHDPILLRQHRHRTVTLQDRSLPSAALICHRLCVFWRCSVSLFSCLAPHPAGV